MTGSALLAAVAVAVVTVHTAPSQSDASAARRAIVDELVVANHILANEAVVDGYGHVSVRDPGDPTHYLLARAGAPSLVGASDIAAYDLESQVVPTGGSAPQGRGYTERFIHGEIYKARPDVMAVVHCHCLDVIPFAAASVPLRPMYHMGFFIAQGVPEWDVTAAGGADMLVRTNALGRSLAQALGNRSAVLMRGHGAALAATSLHLVVGEAYYLNVNARLQLQAMQLGGQNFKPLSDKESKSSPQDYERSWETWKARLPHR